MPCGWKPDKTMELTASSHHSSFFWPSHDSIDESVLSESVSTGAQRKDSVPTRHIVLVTVTWDGLFSHK